MGPIQPANISLIERHIQSTLTHTVLFCLGHMLWSVAPLNMMITHLERTWICHIVGTHLHSKDNVISKWRLSYFNIIFWSSANKSPGFDLYHFHSSKCAQVLGVKKGDARLKRVNANYPNRQMSLQEFVCHFFTPDGCNGFMLRMVICPPPLLNQMK